MLKQLLMFLMGKEGWRQLESLKNGGFFCNERKNQEVQTLYL